MNESADILEKLHSQKGVPPEEVLDVLAFRELRDRLYPASEKAKLRSLSQRKKAAKKLHESAAILQEWRHLRFHSLDRAVLWSNAYMEPFTYDQDLPERVRGVADALSQLGGASAYRPQKVKVREIAMDLATIFHHYTGNFLFHDIGELLLAACSKEEWYPAGTIEDAVRRLIERDRKKIASAERYTFLRQLYAGIKQFGASVSSG